MTQEAKLNLPWTGQAVKASRTRYNYCTIWGRMGVKIADVQGRGRASTEARRDLIVAAVNLHGELVEALESVQKVIAEGAAHGFQPLVNNFGERLYETQQTTSAVLAKAKVQP